MGGTQDRGFYSFAPFLLGNPPKSKKEKAMSTITDQVLDIIAHKLPNEFTISEILELDSSFKPNTIRTIVSRDLHRRGFVIRKKEKRGKERLYLFNDGKPKRKTLKAKVTPKTPPKEEKQIPEELEQIPTKVPDSSYVRIGKGIEQLLEEKNHTIDTLEAKCKALKKQLLDAEATVQDRDNHIVEQGKKIHQLSEMVRNKQGGAIKLDELQRIVNGAKRPVRASEI